jgi:hypothetical protein
MLGEQVFRDRNSDVVAAAAGYRTGESRPKQQYAPETRPNADSTISLLTLRTASLYVATPNNLGTHGLSGIATFGELHAFTRYDVVAET